MKFTNYFWESLLTQTHQQIRILVFFYFSSSFLLLWLWFWKLRHLILTVLTIAWSGCEDPSSSGLSQRPSSFWSAFETPGKYFIRVLSEEWTLVSCYWLGKWFCLMEVLAVWYFCKIRSTSWKSSFFISCSWLSECRCQWN